MAPLPDEAIVVRGGLNLPESFFNGSGVVVVADDKLKGVSVNSAAGMSVWQLVAGNAQTGYPGIPHNQVGVTTVGAIRAAGGDVIASPRQTNPYHATLGGLTAEQASSLFRPTSMNPRKAGTEP